MHRPVGKEFSYKHTVLIFSYPLTKRLNYISHFPKLFQKTCKFRIPYVFWLVSFLCRYVVVSQQPSRSSHPAEPADWHGSQPCGTRCQFRLKLGEMNLTGSGKPLEALPDRKTPTQNRSNPQNPEAWHFLYRLAVWNYEQANNLQFQDIQRNKHTNVCHLAFGIILSNSLSVDSRMLRSVLVISVVLDWLIFSQCLSY